MASLHNLFPVTPRTHVALNSYLQNKFQPNNTARETTQREEKRRRKGPTTFFPSIAEISTFAPWALIKTPFSFSNEARLPILRSLRTQQRGSTKKRPANEKGCKRGLMKKKKEKQKERENDEKQTTSEAPEKREEKRDKKAQRKSGCREQYLGK